MDRNLSQPELESQMREESVTPPHAVVLRAALRGFIKIIGKLEPSRRILMLDDCVDFVSNIAHQNAGEVYGVDYESVTVGFGLRNARIDGSAEAAVRTARQPAQSLREVAGRWRENIDSAFALSIGIHVGEVLAASAGSISSRNSILVGDTVKLAVRLAQRARAGEAILSAPIREALRDQLPEVEIKPLGGMSFDTRSQRIDIHCIPRADRLDLGEHRRRITRH